MSVLIFVFAADAFELNPPCGTTPLRWDLGVNPVITYSIDDAWGGSSHEDAIVDAVMRWDSSAIPQSEIDVDFSLGFSPPLDLISKIDGANSITFADSVDGCFWGSDAVEYWVRKDICAFGLTGTFREVDISLYNCATWETNLDYLDFNDPDSRDRVLSTQQHVVRLVGFTLGLQEEDGAMSGTSYDGWPVTMALHSLDGGMVISEEAVREGRHYLVGEDDREGLRSLYPDTTGEEEDLAVQSYTVRDASAEAGACDAGVARPSPSYDMILEIPDGPFDECRSSRLTSLPVQKLYQGAPFDVEFTLHNLGSNTVLTDVEVRLESEDTSNPDFALLTLSASLGPGRPYELEEALEIPIDADPGRYYVAFLIDPDDDVNETDEVDNNVAYWNRAIDVEELPSCTGCSAPAGPAGAGFTAVALVAAALRRRTGRGA